MRGKTLLVLAGLLGAGLVGYRYLPPHLNPLAPLALDDPPGWLTSFKLRSLTADQCASLLAEANRRRLIASQPAPARWPTASFLASARWRCPLRNVVRVARSSLPAREQARRSEQLMQFRLSSPARPPLLALS